MGVPSWATLELGITKCGLELPVTDNEPIPLLNSILACIMATELLILLGPYMALKGLRRPLKGLIPYMALEGLIRPLQGFIRPLRA